MSLAMQSSHPIVARLQADPQFLGSFIANPTAALARAGGAGNEILLATTPRQLHGASLEAAAAIHTVSSIAPTSSAHPQQPPVSSIAPTATAQPQQPPLSSVLPVTVGHPPVSSVAPPTVGQPPVSSVAPPTVSSVAPHTVSSMAPPTIALPPVQQ